MGLDHCEPDHREADPRRELGGTVNDVVLAAITRGFRDLLMARGELSDGLVVRSLISDLDPAGG